MMRSKQTGFYNLVFCLGMMLMTACNATSKTQPIYQDPSEMITVKKGTVFTIELPSNIATGYSWELFDSLDTTMIEVVNKKYTENDMMTSEEESKESWQFKALKKGKTQIKMIYKRPWEAESDDAKLRNFEVMIQ